MESTKTYYFDYAAATPLDERVLLAMQPYFAEYFYNPSSPYEPARKVRRAIDDARSRIARLVGGKPYEILFTAGATESINLLFNSVLIDQAHCVTIASEHDAVLQAAQQTPCTIVGVDEKGRVKLEELESSILPTTQLVSVSLANNELGTLHPIKAIAAIIHAVRKQRLEVQNHTPLYFHVDGSQGVGFVDIHTARLGIDAFTLNASKVYGPKQVGVLWVTSNITLLPLIRGGGQERGVRSGTENVPAIIGSALAFEIAEGSRKAETKRLTELRRSLEKQLFAHFPDCLIPGSTKQQLPHIMTVSFPGVDAERIVFALETRSILVATGAACAANKSTASHVLRAIGLSEEVIGGSIRLSFGRSTTEEHITTLIEALKEIVPKERQYDI